MRQRSRLRPNRPPVARPRPLDEDRVATSDPEPRVLFDALGLSEPVMEAVRAMGFTEATPIQARAIPPGREGRDVIGQAHTGSGKTVAFGVPIVERSDPNGPAVQALVLCPTRELCVQVHDELTRLGAPRGIRSIAIFGGEAIKRQLDLLHTHPQVVVATPGRLLDHCNRGTISLAGVRIAVLDEADRMLDMGFAPDVERILRQCPTDRQTLLFSATVPDWVARLSSKYMRDPERITVSDTPEIASDIRQLYLQTSWADKVDALSRILDQPDLTMALIFTETKRNADMLEIQLRSRGYNPGLLHGDLSQKDRDRAMQQFKDAHTRSLIATNIAARGLDIDDISHVINFDVPLTPEDYLHRVGRTGRAGRKGVAVTLITPSEILRLRDVERMARTRIERASLDVDFPVVADQVASA